MPRVVPEQKQHPEQDAQEQDPGRRDDPDGPVEQAHVAQGGEAPVHGEVERGRLPVPGVGSEQQEDSCGHARYDAAAEAIRDERALCEGGHLLLVRLPGRRVQPYIAPVRVVVLPGDGIGPAVVEATMEVLEATGIAFEWELHELGQRAFDDCGAALPESVVAAVLATGLAIKGPVATPVGAPYRSVNVALRRALDLYVQVRPLRSVPGAPSVHEGVNLAVVRETTEDLYAGVELMAGSAGASELIGLLAREGHDVAASTGFSVKPQSPEAARRALRRALKHAATHGHRRVTIVHKASVMRATDAVFLREGMALAQEHPELEVDAMAVDAAAAALVRTPQAFGVLVTTNLYGDILSDVGAAVIGGLGLAPGVNLGDAVAVFEAAHGTAPRHAGADRADPFAMVLSGALLLDHVGEPQAADRVRRAVAAVVRQGTDVTYDLRSAADLRPPVGTRRAARAVVERLQTT